VTTRPDRRRPKIQGRVVGKSPRPILQVLTRDAFCFVSRCCGQVVREYVVLQI
jgi:hypothetical protein